MARSKPQQKSTLHHHGCKECNRRYVCPPGCLDTSVNGRCNVCISGIESWLALAWLPRECCYANQPLQPMHKDQIRVYKLAGPGPWFKCPECARTFPSQPQKVRTTA